MVQLLPQPQSRESREQREHLFFLVQTTLVTVERMVVVELDKVRTDVVV